MEGINKTGVVCELKTAFSALSESELRGVLCRLQHVQCGDVRTLRGNESEVKAWLDAQHVKPSKAYQEILNSEKKSKYAREYSKVRWKNKWRDVVAVKSELLNIIILLPTLAFTRMLVSSLLRF